MVGKSQPIRGLVRVKGTDRDEVANAKKHLLSLLEDPHYREAYIRLAKAGALPKMPSGSIPVEHGKLARKLIENDIKATRRKRGRPQTLDEGRAKLVLDVIAKSNLSKAEVARRLLAANFPNDPEGLIKNKAEALGQYFRDLGKRLKNKSPNRS